MQKLFFLIPALFCMAAYSQTTTYTLPDVNKHGLVSPGTDSLYIIDKGLNVIVSPSGVPIEANSQTSNGRTWTTRKGELNHYRLRPRILTEHVETARGEQATVTSSQLVGQIFRASTDNINGIYLTLESASGTTIDNFESYADSAALQAVWTETDAADPAALATVIVGTGTKSMLLPMSATVGDEWYKTNVVTDYTGYTFEMQWYQSVSFSQAQMSFYIQDNVGNSKYLPLVVEQADAWETFDFQETAMVETTGNSTDTDTTKILRVGFRLDDNRVNADGYADEIKAIPEPGEIALELWDMGTTLPTSGVTTLNDGNQYEELGDRGINGGTVSTNITVELIGGKRLYDIYEFIAGTALEIPGNTTITNDNYYALVLRYVDTDVTVFGANTTYSNQYYNSGYAFTATNNITVMSQIGTYNDICFGIFAAEDAYLNTLITQYRQSDGSAAAPGLDAVEIVNIENRNMYITDYLVGASRPQPFVIAEFKDTRPYMPKGSKLEVNHTDDSSDNVNSVSVFIGYLYQEIDTND
jgi:hypothetical protein